MPSASRETQNYVPMDLMRPYHLCQIQEESGSRESGIREQRRGRVEREEEESGDDVSVKPERTCESERADPASLVLYEQQRRWEDNRCLLEELTVIEAELRETVRLEVERQRELDFLRLQDNRLRWQSLHYLSLNQRVNRPWVSSYFRRFPMHIYCLPIQNVPFRAVRKTTKARR